MWVIAALANSLLSANNAEINRRYQQEGFRLNMWRTLFAALWWAPLAVLQDWPNDPAFYGAAVFGGISIIVGNVITNNLAAQHNGRVAIIHMPLKAIMVFIVWAILDDHARQHILDNPLVTLAVFLCLGTMVLSMDFMRRNDASWHALIQVLPIVVLYSIGDVLTRITMPADVLSDRIVVYLFIVTAVSAGVSGLLLPWRPRPNLPLYTPKLMRAAGEAAISSTINHIVFLIALSHAPNPAYVSMVGLLAPVWLLVYHRLKGVPDNANPWAGTVLVLAAIIMVWVTH